VSQRPAYGSDITDEEWSYLEPLLPGSKFGTARGGRPQEFPTREIVNGIRYVLRTGCAWRLMPHDLPPWWTVYHYMRRWKRDGTWSRIHDKLRGDVRQSEGRERMPSAAIMDTQSVKTTSRGAFAVTMRARKSVDASVT
jgi:putative transposase